MNVAVYSKAGCPFCSLLKMEMRKRGIPFDEIDLSDDANRQKFYDRVGVNTVPQVFLTDENHAETAPSGVRLGGWSEVSKNWEAFETE